MLSDEGYSPSRDLSGGTSRPDDQRDDRRSPSRPQGDSRFPAHIMAAVRQTIRSAAATCVEPSRLEASGPYEWLAIVEAHDGELYQLLRLFIESSRYLDDLERQGEGLGLGQSRLAEAVRNATFARESMRTSLAHAIERRAGGGLADV
ncbi:MAG: hypothetical protein JWL95_2810 [Gemmatimonadetes bacterium]|nr:hypothetical protein [Gemmatimonadota bacterium]